MAQPVTSQKQFAEALLRWFNEVPEGSHDWAEALIAAALDEERKDPMKALEMAKREFAAHPTPPAEGGP